MAIIRSDEHVGPAGSVPPAHAPHETSQPISDRLLADQLEVASQHEQVLPPFNPRPAVSQPVGPVSGQILTKPVRRVSRGTVPSPAASPTGGIVLTDADAAALAPGNPGDDHDPTTTVPVVSVDGAPVIMTVHHEGDDGLSSTSGTPANPATTSALAAAARGLMARRPALPAPGSAEPYRPAASNTDSPSRGVPRPIDDPGKRITGGFGAAGANLYYPLSGDELRELVYKMMDDLADQLRDDLRFSMALTYPRVTARVVVEVRAYPEEAASNFDLFRFMPAHEKAAPEEIAREHCDEVIFLVVQQRREMSPDGQSEAPPDKLRDEAGLIKPQKQAIDTAAGRMFVDRTDALRATTGIAR